MSYALGVAYLVSLFVLTLVVVTVYSAAQDAHLTVRELIPRALHRAGKLVGVLGVLAIAVYFLSKN